MSKLHETQTGVPCLFKLILCDGKVYVECGICEEKLNISQNWHNATNHSKASAHMANVHCIHNREQFSADVSEKVELLEIQASRFVKNEVADDCELTEDDNGRKIIACVICKHRKAFQLTGRPSYQARVRELVKGGQHKKKKETEKTQKRLDDYFKSPSHGTILSKEKQ